MMRVRNTALILATAAAVGAIALVPPTARAKYPRISSIGDLTINMNETGPLMRFLASNEVTLADQLVVTYRSDNPWLIPNDDDHITLGGSGQDHTLVITPAPDQWGFGNVMIIVKDTDGDMSREPFLVGINGLPNL
jgi:hypothetical protein